jgi:activator of Hsp90 ATPase-like protein
MTIAAPDIEQLTLNITEEILIRSSLTATFAALLEEMGPANEGHAGTPMPMVLEPWPGGRWFRDLGGNNGHLWGHVQAIKAPTLLEITGPLMMSFAVSSNLQYRLKEVDGGTLLTLRHSALGLFPDGFREAMVQGWPNLVGRLQRRLEKSHS